MDLKKIQLFKRRYLLIPAFLLSGLASWALTAGNWYNSETTTQYALRQDSAGNWESVISIFDSNGNSLGDLTGGMTPEAAANLYNEFHNADGSLKEGNTSES